MSGENFSNYSNSMHEWDQGVTFHFNYRPLRTFITQRSMIMAYLQIIDMFMSWVVEKVFERCIWNMCDVS